MPSTTRLFSPLTIGRVRLRNRLVFESRPTDFTSVDGFINQPLLEFYQKRAEGGVGAIVTAPIYPVFPQRASLHLGLYDDAYIHSLHDCVSAIQAAGCATFVMLDQLEALPESASMFTMLAEAYLLAAWRAHAAGAAGVMFSTADGGSFRLLNEPGVGDLRLATLMKIIEMITAWIGRRFLIGVRVSVDEQTPGGLSLQDARVVSRRLMSAGVRFLEIVVRVGNDTPHAQFPGWCVPVAAACKRILEIPVMVGGELDDPDLAEMSVQDGSVDLVAVGDRLEQEPEWPLQARTFLESFYLDQA